MPKCQHKIKVVFNGLTVANRGCITPIFECTTCKKYFAVNAEDELIPLIIND